EGPERIEAEEALRCYTAESAYAQFAEERKGTLAPGMLADFAVLTGDPTSLCGQRIRDISVAETVVGGESVWKMPAGSQGAVKNQGAVKDRGVI
ncbi:MAG: amidohydrolase family protein, partial [Spirochaetaceae bacterium]|nr:amidohydrolase family protein [Spirochaetaceae bacterium]